MTKIVPNYPVQLPEGEPYIDDLRNYFNQLMDTIRNGVGNILISKKILCELQGGLLNWQANREFFWDYLINIDGKGNYFPNPLEIATDTSFTVYTREHFLPEKHFTHYKREVDTYTYKNIDEDNPDNFVWVNDVTGETFPENKTVVAYAFNPSCRIVK